MLDSVSLRQEKAVHGADFRYLEHYEETKEDATVLVVPSFTSRHTVVTSSKARMGGEPHHSNTASHQERNHRRGRKYDCCLAVHWSSLANTWEMHMSLQSLGN
jgi:hypothetical protein